MNPIKKFFKENKLLIYTIIIIAASFFTYFKNYDYPPHVFWDENYHVASAEKYLENVMFMEPHPPLGKIFVAAGEYLFHPNDEINKSGFTQTDYIKDFPNGYSFKGVRFFSAFFAWMSALAFFYILYFISKNPHTALIFSSLYIFENALITHSRAAMLEGSHIFFILLGVLYFVYSIRNLDGETEQKKKRKIRLYNYLILGIFAGLAISIKATGAIMFLFFPFLYAFDHKEKFREIRKNLLPFIKFFFIKGAVFSIGALAVFAIIWQIHFSLGKIVLNDKYYKASEEYKEIIKNAATADPGNFFLMFKDNLAYIANYNKGVPKLDVCKADENGSHPLVWPVGNKSINYRWEKGGEEVRYMYLQGNPVIWFTGLISVIISIVLVVSKFIFKLPVKNKKIFYLITCFTILYAWYMVSMLQIERVLYLYHYFIPLIFSLILAYLQFNYIFGDILARKPKIIYPAIIAFAIGIIWTYSFFAPLSYYQPLTTEQFKQRIWFDFWKLKPVE